MIIEEYISTPRIKQHVLRTSQTGINKVLFIHGNASSAVFWKSTMETLPENFEGFAVDLRGYGETEDLTIDATRGFGDFVDDIIETLDYYNIKKCHVIGHSLGGGIVFSLLAESADRFLTATLVNPASPFGFGGTKTIDGQPCYADFSGSGGGIVNSEFARLIEAQDRTESNPQASPRVVMNSFYWKPPFVPANIEELLSSLLTQKIGPTRYPGDFVDSENYPFVAPGIHGPINASSPKYLGKTIEKFIATRHKCPILWLRGCDDLIVSDNSFFDFGTLGKLGYIPNYPGDAVYPPQPMISQTRFVLDKYLELGGNYAEVELENTGHTPFIESPEIFNAHFHAFLKG